MSAVVALLMQVAEMLAASVAMTPPSSILRPQAVVVVDHLTPLALMEALVAVTVAQDLQDSGTIRQLRHHKETMAETGQRLH